MKFIQISNSDESGLVALDSEGQVWEYIDQMVTNPHYDHDSTGGKTQNQKIRKQGWTRLSMTELI